FYHYFSDLLRSVIYFLKPSYWSTRSKRYVEVSSVYEVEVNGTPMADESVEPVSPEFRGKEAIRICNIRKTYKEKDSTVEALRGLTFDIYEGQITALLGHSGAGKSTLMNILCGICPPTEGSATIYGSPVAEIADGAEMKQLVGICPQFNIIFDVLTVEEHLRIFAAIKGILPSEIDSEVRKVLKDLDLEKIMDAQAKNLSGGQKRKLSVGIAILGDPKILLLDEPTAGMDPVSRHQVWTLLKNRRAGRVTVLSTHYMDEADILADRKAVISQGQLKCVGSSLYLKTKCGVGYHLRMSVTEVCEVDSLASLVKQHVPKAQLSRQQEAELTFTLPFESMETFPGLFAELDCRPDLGIINYGVSMTTLEDVFLRLEDKVEDEGDASSLDEMDQRLLTFSDSRQDAVKGHALWRQQFSTVAWLHMLNLQRERKPIIYKMLLLSQYGVNHYIIVYDMIWHNPNIHFSNLNSFSLQGFSYIVAFNSTTVHSLPMAVNVLSNALYRGFNGTGKIKTWTKPFDYVSAADFLQFVIHCYNSCYYISMLLYIIFLLFCGYLSQMTNIKCRSTLRISGMVPSAYWCGQAAVDIPFYYLILICMTSTLFAFHSTNLLSNSNVMSVVRKSTHTYCLNKCTASDLLVFCSCFTQLLFLCSLVMFLLHCVLCLQPYLQCILLLFLLRWLEIRYGGQTMKNDQLLNTYNGDSFSCSQKPVVVVSNLRKQYSGKKEGFSLGKKRKVAAKNISFCVRKGEVLGLLGPNGAGKSTIMHMLSGDTNPTAGQVCILMGDYGTEFRPVDNPLEHVGYCPQVNPLWPRITLQEHLQIYAAIKGLRHNDVPNIIRRVVNALELKDHLHKQAKNLSAGLKRKLCFALSMLGNPQIVLLDEPSSGMDPKSKQRMWRALRAAFKNKQRGAILTTHYMEEAEAVCDRVAIMVSGQLRCIGSIQHLKAKYGRGYSLEIKLREELTGLQQVALLHKEILRIFPHAARQESFATLMVYKIPMEDVKSLAQAFSRLESAKQNFNFEEYNFSQCTLEQVGLLFFFFFSPLF
uniref:Cholesterol transporter ABCA5 n=1 Tax=Astyanax mexicanus TaxID=7994 RepID=A0A8B9KE70_ASTMX